MCCWLVQMTYLILYLRQVEVFLQVRPQRPLPSGDASKRRREHLGTSRHPRFQT